MQRSGETIKYKIYASLKEDINEGFCWMNQLQLPSRTVIRIIDMESNKKVFCEALSIDKNFVKHYDERVHTYKIKDAQSENIIILSQWYRVRLGDLKTQAEANLKIKICKSKWAKVRACIQHPQIAIRLGTWLAILSVFLGLIGFGLGAWSICLSHKSSANLQQPVPQTKIANQLDNSKHSQ